MTTKKKATRNTKADASTSKPARARKSSAAVLEKSDQIQAVPVLNVTVMPETAPQASATEPARTNEAKAPLTIGIFQKRLYELGFYGGHWDGHYGPMTRDAVCRFQAQHGLPVNGDATPETLYKLGLSN